MQIDRKKISISTLGCKVNQCDSAAACESLQNYGCKIVSFDTTADVYIVNTCAVTEKTESQSRQLIRRALKRNPFSQIIVTGCYVQKSPEDLRAISDRVHVVGNREKKDMPLYVAKLLSGCTNITAVSDICLEKKFTTPAGPHFFERTRAFLKIQDGCNARCSYCIVPSVRGPSRSLPKKDVKLRLQRLIQAGYREVVLCGIHLGAYGLDLVPSTTFCDLLETLESAGSFPGLRIRLSSVEPTEFSDGLIGFLSQSRIICPHLHIPLQSGDTTILKRMGRPYTPLFFSRLIDRLTSAIPDVNIGVDVIAGFPAESEGQFQSTVKLIQSLPVGYLHVFPYSRRQGTAAAGFSRQVPEPVKKKRVNILRQVSTEKKNSFYSYYIRKNIRVLVEGKREKGTGFLKGFSRNYIPVLLDGTDDLIGQEVEVKITRVNKDKVYGVAEI